TPKSAKLSGLTLTDGGSDELQGPLNNMRHLLLRPFGLLADGDHDVALGHRHSSRGDELGWRRTLLTNPIVVSLNRVKRAMALLCRCQRRLPAVAVAISLTFATDSSIPDAKSPAYSGLPGA